MNEHIKKFDELYAKMAESSDVKDMHLFGKVMREAMQYVAGHSPAQAEEMIEKLCAIEYKNYLTRKEAEEIISKMEPAPKWNIEQLRRSLVAIGTSVNEKPCYNEYALYVTMSMIASDSKETLEKYAGATEDGKFFELCYHLALDKLKDKDGMFDVREYFKL